MSRSDRARAVAHKSHRDTARGAEPHTGPSPQARTQARERLEGAAKMKVVGYIRVSTEKQANDGLGLAVQERAVRRWAKDEGHRLVAILRDKGLSGGLPADEREGLTGALNLVKDGKADGLVVPYLDRLARELHVQEAVLTKVWSCGGKVFTVDGGEVAADDVEDPMRTFVRQVIGAVAQLERGMIRKRLQNGRREKAAGGGYAYGRPPFGYKATEGELVPDEDEQKALKRIRQLVRRRRGGRPAPASLREIAGILEAEHFKPKQSDRWHPQALSLIIGRLEATPRKSQPKKPTRLASQD